IFTIELFSFPKSNTWIYDTGCGTHICNTIQGLRGYRKLNKGALDLYVGNGHSAAVEAIGSFELILPSRMILMARKPFTHASERADDLLGIIHSDVCGPFRTTGYALESAARILNMVPTKKVNKTPYEMWHGKVSNLSYLKFFETNLIKQEENRSIVDFDEIQREDAQPSENTSLHQHEVEHDEHELGDHGEPPNYRAALLDPESEKWLEAMNAEMQSMKDNQV
ncbi:hypothetical protein Tco_0962356, partial [Tanacetum coccineum]